MSTLFLYAAIAAFIGGSMYLGEVHHNRVSLATRWKDLDRYQWVAVILAIGGIVLALGALIAGAILKGA